MMRTVVALAALSASAGAAAQGVGPSPGPAAGQSVADDSATLMLRRLIGEGNDVLPALSTVLGSFGDDPAQVSAVITEAVRQLAAASATGSTPTQAMLDAAGIAVANAALAALPADMQDAVVQGVLLAGSDPTALTGLAATAAGPPGAGGAPGTPLAGPPTAGGGAGAGGGVSPSG